MAEIEIGYWKIRGLGAVLRMLLEYKEAKYKDSQYESGDDWFATRKPDILKLNPLANLPYVVDGECCVCQTNAVLSYLGDKFGLNGGDDALKLRTQQLLAEIYDVRNDFVGICYPFKGICRDQEEFETKAKKKCAKPPFSKFESYLEFYGGDWFVLPDGPGPADFHIWEMLDQHRLLAEKMGEGPILDEFPNCKAFYERLRALPTLQAPPAEGQAPVRHHQVVEWPPSGSGPFCCTRISACMAWTRPAVACSTSSWEVPPQAYFDSPAYKLPINNGSAKAYFL